MQRISPSRIERVAAPIASARIITDFTLELPRRNEPMRLDGDLCEVIRKIAAQCNTSTCAVLSRIVRDALPYVAVDGELVYRPGGGE